MIIQQLFLLSDGMSVKIVRLSGKKSVHQIDHMKSLGSDELRSVLHQLKDKVDADLFKKYMIVGISSHLDREHTID